MAQYPAVSNVQRVSSGEVQLAVSCEGDPGKPTLLFVHGYPDTKEVWDRVRERLAGDFHCVAYDVRGAGESTAPRASAAYDLRLLGDDLDAVIDAVRPNGGVHLIGHDWGGIQGWEFATSERFRGRLASFTAVAGPSLDQVSLSGKALIRRGRLLKVLFRARRSWYILVLLTPGGPEFAWRVILGGRRWRRALERREGIPSGLDYPGPNPGRAAIHGANLYRRNIPRRTISPRRDAIAHVPVQLVIPERDRYIPLDYYESAEQYARDLRRHTIDAHHWVQLTHPDEVAELIRTFVSEVEGAR